MIGSQFNGVDGEEGISIQDLISNPLDVLPGAPNPGGIANAAQLWYWDPNEPGNYVTLFLCDNSTYNDGANHGKWCTTTTLPNDTSWGDKMFAPSTKRLTSGMGLWLIRPTYDSAVTLTMAGQAVIAQSGRTYSLHSGFNMISGGFTTGFEINKEGLDWIALGLTGAQNPGGIANADQIWYWDPKENGKYVTLFLCNNKDYNGGANYGKWCTTTVLPTDTSWGDKMFAPSPKVIPMGRGFWLVRPNGAGNVTITIPQPYSL